MKKKYHLRNLQNYCTPIQPCFIKRNNVALQSLTKYDKFSD